MKALHVSMFWVASVTRLDPWTLSLHRFWKPAHMISLLLGTWFLLITVAARNSTGTVCLDRNTMLGYMLLFCIATTVAHVDIFVFKEYEEESGRQGNPTEEIFGGSLPPDLTLVSSSSSSCSCSKLILSSLGPAAIFQPHVMGVYTKVYICRMILVLPIAQVNSGMYWMLYFILSSSSLGQTMVVGSLTGKIMDRTTGSIGCPQAGWWEAKK